MKEKREVKSKGYTLIVTEKPTAARRIAHALAEGEVKVHEENKVKYYEIRRKGKRYLIAPAVGHLFALKQVSRGWDYPVFDLDWKPTHLANRKSRFAEKYFKLMKKLASKATDVIIATDYDEEGEVIGYNILRFLCNGKKAKRMRFSTLTKKDIITSFENLSEVDMNLVKAGYARHFIDWYFGVNFTRALTNALKNHGERFSIISIGRVQGPTLRILAMREREIAKFKPRKYWQVFAKVLLGENELKARYEKERLWRLSEAKAIAKTKNKKGKVIKVVSRLSTRLPPFPYDTTSLLSDAFRFLGFSPMKTMRVAESLYQKGHISYPRTSSQQLPSTINLREIVASIGKLRKYSKFARVILKGELKPRESKKSDPAHPAIHPTCEVPSKLPRDEARLYDLIVRRFLACLMKEAKRQTTRILIDLNGFTFFVKGARTIESGWLSVYEGYNLLEEVELPEVKEGDVVLVKRIEIEEKETLPPQRYTQGSIVREMEARGLGTKATRAQILQILYDRGYIHGTSIRVSKLGLDLVEILEKNVPIILSEELTRELERSCDAIYKGEKDIDDVLSEARKRVEEIARRFRKREATIGELLNKALIESQEKMRELGKCPRCGGKLKIFVMRKRGTRFVGCENYKRGCDFSAPLPRNGLILPTGKTCKHCGAPIIKVIRRGKRPFTMCINPSCESKRK